MQKKVELLAPAGNMDCFKAALNAGADAVYVGGQKFGARAYAGNFNDEELLLAIKLAHFWNRKVYLTVNTLLKEEELGEVVPYLRPFYEAGLDGIIVQDLGVLKVCREQLPGLALHASTQMTVTESGAAALLKELGVERIVPARELSLDEIIKLKEESGLEIETFIHGAMCYCYSGQCLFSSFLGGRSGNRGRCAQPCRQPYQINIGKHHGKDEKYPLSLKDLCVLPMLPSLIEAGIDSFKIEGRMKSPEYVAGVTAMYRKYIDMYYQNANKWRVDKKDLSFLSGLYVRSSLEQGYYKRHNGQEMVTLDKPGYAGCSDEVLESIREKWLNKEMQRPVSLKMILTAETPAMLYASCNLEDGAYLEVFCEGMKVSHAQKRPLTEADVEKQLKKTGGSNFCNSDIEIIINGEVFLPVGAMNDLRRQVLEKLTDAVCAHFSKSIHNDTENCMNISDKKIAANFKHSESPQLRVSALFVEQAAAAVNLFEVQRVYLSADALISERKSGSSIFELIEKRKMSDSGFSFYITMPAIIRAYTKDWLEKLDEIIKKYDSLIDGICVMSLSGIAAIRQYGWKKDIALHSGAYTWNKESLSQYDQFGNVVTYEAPLELNRSTLYKLPKERMELPVYGRIPMMISANCVRKTAGECQVCHNAKSLSAGIDRRLMDIELTDRYQVKFPVLTNCMHCMNTIYNSVPLSLHTYMDEILLSGIQGVRLEFTDEKAEMVKKIIAFYAGGNENPIDNFTTGHYKKGAQ